jgi:peptidoglycan/LPS O-acetylase OafA/YrhL
MSSVATRIAESAPEARMRLEVAARPAAHFYRPELDVLRFFAFLSVFFYHGLPAFDVSRHSGVMARLALYETRVRDAGSFGVCLFFLLSSYLITELLLRERKLTGTVHVRSFYTRRVLRIWPLYFAFLLFGVVLSVLVPAYALESRALVSFLFLAGNWYVAGRAATLSDNPIWPLWSVSVEEQFYLLWPWIAKLGGERWVRRISLAILPISYACLYMLARRGPHTASSARFNSVVQFQFFALGALLALVLHGRALRLRPIVRVVLLSAGVASWLAANFVFHVDFAGAIPSAGRWVAGYAMVAIGSLLLLVAFLGVSPSVLPGPLVYLGKISYGLYVFHMLVLNLVGPAMWPTEMQRAAMQTPAGIANLMARGLLILCVGLAGTIALSAASYRFLERPFLSLKERFTLIRSRSA